MVEENIEPGVEEKYGVHGDRRRGQDESLYPIDHSVIIDGFAELAQHNQYLPFDTPCGICGLACHVSSRQQKYILEVNRVPVKMLVRGAVFCEGCLERRVALKELRKGRHDHDKATAKALIEKYLAEEEKLKRQARPLSASTNWPY